MLGRGITEILGEENGRPFMEAIRRVLARGQPEQLDYSLGVPGGLRWFRARVSPIAASDGSFRSVSMLIRDMTAAREADERLQREAALLENMIDAVVGSDANFRLITWNAAAESLYGWRADEVLGRNGLEILRTEWPGVDPAEMRRKIADEGRWRGEATQARKDGTRIAVEVSSVVLRDDSMQITGWLSVNHDITERNRAAEEIKIQLAELRRWHSVTLGREQRVLDLKQEVNELLGRAGQLPRYPGAESQDKPEA